MSLIPPVNYCQHNRLLQYDNTIEITRLTNKQLQLYHTLIKLFPLSQHNNNTVSLQQVNRMDIECVTRQLHQLLKERNAKLSGICNIRNDIYNDLFNELIRQVTIDSPLHGELLHHIYNQLNHTLFAYHMLCNNSSDYSMNQYSQLDAQKYVDTDKLNAIKKDTIELTHQLNQLKHEYTATIQEQQYSDELYERQCNEQIAYHKQNNTYLEQLIQKHTANETQPV